MPQIEVAFDIDANGIVSVSAKDKASGKEQKITIQASGGLSKEDVERMIKEAEANAGEDKKRKELVEVRNHADALLHSTEKSLKEYGDKLSGDEKSKIEQDLANLKTALSSEDIEDIKTKTEILASSAMKIGELMYKNQQAESSATESSSENSSSDDDGKVVDADFEEVENDDKK
jgi:molecular chaperone DnaK